MEGTLQRLRPSDDWNYNISVAMLEQPDIPNAQISQCLNDAFGIHIVNLAFLPIGADINTAVYRAIATDRKAYFVKLRRGAFDPTSVELPKYLSDLGIRQIIAPHKTQTGQLWAKADAFALIVYPFIEGQDGYQVALSEQQWHEFGNALKRIHSAAIPESLSLKRESYSALWREQVRGFLRLAESETFDDPIAVELATLLKEKHSLILSLVERAEQLAQVLQAQPPEVVICHSDIHAGNILIGANGSFHIVDWDNPLLAPKERDLMFIGGGQGFIGYSAEQEEALFYQGYGPVQINTAALVYYRYERIVQDIAAFCQEILFTAKGEDRAQALRYLSANFAPGGTLEMAYQSDKNSW